MAVEPRRLYRQIADQIAQLIASGEYPAGARLPAERELASLLRVSRTSVREAIISLEINGLVEVRVGTGVFVLAAQAAIPRAGGDGGPGPFELLAARRLVEGEVAALAASEADVTDAAALRESVARMEAKLDDFEAREAEDRDFHLRLARATRNGSLELVVEGLWNQRAGLWGRLQQHFHTRELALQAIRDHAAIARAIASRDATAARTAMHRHLARVARQFQRAVDAGSSAATGRAPPASPTRPASAKQLASVKPAALAMRPRSKALHPTSVAHAGTPRSRARRNSTP